MLLNRLKNMLIMTTYDSVVHILIYFTILLLLGI